MSALTAIGYTVDGVLAAGIGWAMLTGWAPRRTPVAPVEDDEFRDAGAGTDEPYTSITETDASFLSELPAKPHTCLPHYPTGAGDTAYRRIQAVRTELNARQGDPQ